MTLGLGFAILFIQFVFQYFWLDDFYYFSKERSIRNELSKIEKIIIDPVEDLDTIEEAIFSSSEQMNSALAVFDRYGQMLYGLNYKYDAFYLTLLSEEGDVYQVYLDSYYGQTDLLKALEVGKDIRVKGYIDSQYNNEVFPEWITVDGVDYGLPVEAIDLRTGLFEINTATIVNDSISTDIYETDLDDVINDSIESEQGIYNQASDMQAVEKIYMLDGSTVIKGKITFSSIRKQLEVGSEYKENQLFEQQLRVFSDDKEAVQRLNAEGYVSFRAMDTYTGLENLVSIKLTKDIYEKELFIFSVLPLQSVKQTTDIMQSYFYITVIIAFVLAILFSYVFSKKITRPLLHLHEVTTNLADIDFSQRCQVSSNDEIEDLAHNINVMSDRLENTLKQLKQFLADASHELKTPLTVMKGLLEGMMDGVYDVKDPEHYQRMLGEINDMSQLVYDLLELSKLESGQVNFKEEIFQLSDVVLKVHNKMSYLVNDKDLKVTLDLDESFVRGNEQYVETVVRNYYANAVQYTPDGGTIDIKMLSKMDQTKLEILNTPSHISEEALEKLWQPFFRVEQSRNKALGGTGLGLYMVKEILEKQGSPYGIQNTKNGVMVYFSLKKVNELEE
jgi:signal transduction histidine kinase